MSEILTETANAHADNAQRYAAELFDKTGWPTSREHAINLYAIAYLEGQCEQLKWARDMVRGDGQ